MNNSRPVLVVDDEASIRRLVELTLTDEGYEVVAAPDGATALELLRTCVPSVILLDMQMPVMDGADFAAAYRARGGALAPIVLLTAATNAEQRASEIDADAYLAKPFDLDQLIAVVERCVASPEAARPAVAS